MENKSLYILVSRVVDDIGLGLRTELLETRGSHGPVLVIGHNVNGVCDSGGDERSHQILLREK